NRLEYKNFQLDFFIQFVKQNGTNYIFEGQPMPGLAFNQPTTVLERWKQTGDKTNVQRFTTGADYNYFMGFYYLSSSDYGVTDASFIRLKNISIAYKLPAKLIEKIKV